MLGEEPQESDQQSRQGEAKSSAGRDVTSPEHDATSRCCCVQVSSVLALWLLRERNGWQQSGNSWNGLRGYLQYLDILEFTPILWLCEWPLGNT
jgi:hypothetical protein